MRIYLRKNKSYIVAEVVFIVSSFIVVQCVRLQIMLLHNNYNIALARARQHEAYSCSSVFIVARVSSPSFCSRYSILVLDSLLRSLAAFILYLDERERELERTSCCCCC